MSEISCIQSQQNSAAHTVHVMWLHEPSSILTMRAPQRGHAFMSPSKQKRHSFRFLLNWHIFFRKVPRRTSVDAEQDFLPAVCPSCHPTNSVRAPSGLTELHITALNHFLHYFPSSALTLLVGREQWHPACKKLGVGLSVMMI